VSTGCSALQRVVLQCVAVRCRASLQHVATWEWRFWWLQCVAARCVAVRCSALQGVVAVCCYLGVACRVVAWLAGAAAVLLLCLQRGASRVDPCPVVWCVWCVCVCERVWGAVAVMLLCLHRGVSPVDPCPIEWCLYVCVGGGRQQCCCCVNGEVRYMLILILLCVCV